MIGDVHTRETARQERLERLEQAAAAAQREARAVVLTEVRRVERLVSRRGERRQHDNGHEPDRRSKWGT
jgi:hypothetical protein